MSCEPVKLGIVLAKKKKCQILKCWKKELFITLD